eukprot:361902-Chlamydomonas_euryale.AAC.1
MYDALSAPFPLECLARHQLKQHGSQPYHSTHHPIPPFWSALRPVVELSADLARSQRIEGVDDAAEFHDVCKAMLDVGVDAEAQGVKQDGEAWLCTKEWRKTGIGLGYDGCVGGLHGLTRTLSMSARVHDETLMPVGVAGCWRGWVERVRLHGALHNSGCALGCALGYTQFGLCIGLCVGVCTIRTVLWAVHWGMHNWATHNAPLPSESGFFFWVHTGVHAPPLNTGPLLPSPCACTLWPHRPPVCAAVRPAMAGQRGAAAQARGRRFD